MQRVLFAVFFCCYVINAQSSNSIGTSSLWLNPTKPSETHQTIKEATKISKDKLSCVLNILKKALSEELATSKLQIIETTTQEPHTSLNRILEEEQNRVDKEEREIQIKVEDEKVPDKALYERVISKIASALSEPQNITNNKNSSDIPNMIPIFKPRQQMPNIPLQKYPDEYNPMTKQALKSRAVSFIPEKIIQTNMSPIPIEPMFNIPCQRAADVLDMNVPIPKEVFSKVNVKPNVSSVAAAPKSSLPTQISSPVTLSVNCADSEDTVAMLFKPQNISLMQMYGNLLKKITITVLVPYHMSKIGS